MAWQTPKTNWAAGDGVANGDLNRIEENVRMLSQSAGAYGICTGSANAYSVTASPPLTALSEGACVAVKINVTNTAGSTINVNGLGAKAIKKGNGLDVAAGQLKAGSIYTLRYNGVNFTLQGEGGSGNATASDLLSGKTASVDAGDIVGTMPDRGTVNYSLPINGSYTIPDGKHSGSGKVTQSIPTKAAATYTPSQSTQTIPSGRYLTGTQTISAVSFDATKVLTGTTIAGKAGTMPNRGSQTATLSITGSTKPTKSISAGYVTASTITAQVDSGQASYIKEGYNLGGCVGTFKGDISTTEIAYTGNTFEIDMDVNRYNKFSPLPSGLVVAVVYETNCDYTSSTDTVIEADRSSGFADGAFSLIDNNDKFIALTTSFTNERTTYLSTIIAFLDINNYKGYSAFKYAKDSNDEWVEYPYRTITIPSDFNFNDCYFGFRTSNWASGVKTGRITMKGKLIVLTL